MLAIGPIERMPLNWSYSSRSGKAPSCICSIMSSCCSSDMAVVIFFRSPLTSPSPSSRCTKDSGSKGSNSSMCSPTPMKAIGDLVAATADSAPPPLAWPSILVSTTVPTSIESWKAFAWSYAAWPIAESITNTTLSGSTASATCFISSKSASLCLCRPLVSTRMMSFFSRRKRSTPSRAIVTGSVSV